MHRYSKGENASTLDDAEDEEMLEDGNGGKSTALPDDILKSEPKSSRKAKQKTSSAALAKNANQPTTSLSVNDTIEHTTVKNNNLKPGENQTRETKHYTTDTVKTESQLETSLNEAGFDTEVIPKGGKKQINKVQSRADVVACQRISNGIDETMPDSEFQTGATELTPEGIRPENHMMSPSNLNIQNEINTSNGSNDAQNANPVLSETEGLPLASAVSNTLPRVPVNSAQCVDTPNTIIPNDNASIKPQQVGQLQHLSNALEESDCRDMIPPFYAQQYKRKILEKAEVIFHYFYILVNIYDAEDLKKFKESGQIFTFDLADENGPFKVEISNDHKIIGREKYLFKEFVIEMVDAHIVNAGPCLKLIGRREVEKMKHGHDLYNYIDFDFKVNKRIMYGNTMCVMILCEKRVNN